MTVKFVQDIEIDNRTIRVNSENKLEAVIPVGTGSDFSVTKTGRTFDRSYLDNQYLILAEFTTSNGVSFIVIDEAASKEKERIETLPYKAVTVAYNGITPSEPVKVGELNEWGWYVHSTEYTQDSTDVVTKISKDDLGKLFKSQVLEKSDPEGKIITDDRTVTIIPRFHDIEEMAQYEQEFVLNASTGEIITAPYENIPLTVGYLIKHYNLDSQSGKFEHPFYVTYDVVSRPDDLVIEPAQINAKLVGTWNPPLEHAQIIED